MGVIDNFGQALSALDQVAGGQLAFENAVLKMIAIGFHRFEDFAKPFVIGDVITNDVGRSHSLKLVRAEARSKKKKKPTRLSKSKQCSTALRAVVCTMIATARSAVLHWCRSTLVPFYTGAVLHCLSFHFMFSEIHSRSVEV